MKRLLFALTFSAVILAGSVPCKAVVGCGAFTDNTTCGPAGSDPYANEGGSQAAFQTGATTLSSCPGTSPALTASTKYYLTVDINAATSGSVCFKMNNGTKVDVNGHSISGRIITASNPNGIHLFHGTLTCNSADSAAIGCVLVSGTNATASDEVSIHHLTVSNTSTATKRTININWPITSVTAPSGYATLIYSNSVDVPSCSTCSRAQAIDQASNGQKMHAYLNQVYCEPDANACQGIGITGGNPSTLLADQNYLEMKTFTVSGGQSGRALLCYKTSAPAPGDGTCDFNNNYELVNNQRAIRFWNRLGVAHDNEIVSSSSDQTVHIGSDSTPPDPDYTGLDIYSNTFDNPAAGFVALYARGVLGYPTFHGNVISGTPVGKVATVATLNSCSPACTTNVSVYSNFSAALNGTVDNNGTGTSTVKGCQTGTFTGTGSFVLDNTLCGGGGGGTPAVELAPQSLGFTSRQVGTTSASQSVTLTNVGSGTLNISSITVSSNYSQSNDCGATLAVSAFCTINVTFAPVQKGNSLQGTLTLTSNASSSPDSITFSAAAYAASMQGNVSLKGTSSIY